MYNSRISRKLARPRSKQAGKLRIPNHIPQRKLLYARPENFTINERSTFSERKVQITFNYPKLYNILTSAGQKGACSDMTHAENMYASENTNKVIHCLLVKLDENVGKMLANFFQNPMIALFSNYLFSTSSHACAKCLKN